MISENNKKIIDKKKRIGLLLGWIILVNILMLILVSAHENFTETKQLIDSEISCDKLTDEQLNEIGDYYMEQMHPGEAHEMMHEMMGGEDSETIRLMHTNMAKSIYCGETNQGMMGMMDMMMGRGGMMDMMYGSESYYKTNSLNSLIQLLIAAVLVLLIILLIKKINKKER